MQLGTRFHEPHSGSGVIDMNNKNKKATSYLILGLMSLSTTAAASVTTFSDGSASVEVELREPGNFMDSWAGAIYCETHSSLTITNSTIAGNNSYGYMGGTSGNIALFDSSTVNLNNSILWNDSPE